MGKKLDQRELGKKLIRAAKANRPDKIIRLAKLGADVNFNDGSESAIHVAVGNKHFECAKKLVELGADINAVDIRGRTALLWAIELNNFDKVRWCVENGADLHVVNPEGNPPLHRAVAGQFLEGVACLIEHGADIHFKNSNGCTALHHSFYSPECTRRLLKCGADANAMGNDGKTVLDRYLWMALASKQNKTLLPNIRLLAEYGADYFDQSDFGMSFLETAKSYDFDDVVEYLETHMEQKRLDDLIKADDNTESMRF